jgi:hypothetical protein
VFQPLVEAAQSSGEREPWRPEWVSARKWDSV